MAANISQILWAQVRRATLVAGTSRGALLAITLAVAFVATAGAGSDGRRPMLPVPPGATTLSAPEVDAETQTSPPVWRGEQLTWWTQRWWRWLHSIPLGADPNGDDDGLNCGINQAGDVWFLAGPVGQTFSSRCTVPAGKAVLSAVNAFINDFPCPDPTFTPAPGQSLNRFLREGAKPLIDSLTLVEARLDGKPLRVRRVATNVFGFTGAASLATYDPCITGSPQLAVSDGWWVFIEPLSPGRHTLELRSDGPYTGPSQGTITLRVR